MLGLPQGEVFLVPWTEEWPREFELEQARISEALVNKVPVTIHHIGSTSVRYLSAKPPDRHYFNKGEPRTHQIHMYESGNRYLLEQLAFRDFLRNNAEERLQYEALKQKLASRHSTNKHQYAVEKTDFVKGVCRK